MECYLSEADRLALPTWRVTHASNFKSAPHDKTPCVYCFWTLTFLYCCCCCLFFGGGKVLRHPSFVCCITMRASPLPLPPKWVQIKRGEKKKWLECNPFKFTYLYSSRSKLNLHLISPRKKKEEKKSQSLLRLINTSTTRDKKPVSRNLFLDNWTPPEKLSFFPIWYLFSTYQSGKTTQGKKKMLLMRTLAVLGLCCIFGVQADFIVDFFSNYSPCANGISVWRKFFFFFFYFLRHHFKPFLVALALPCYVLYCSKKKKKRAAHWLTHSLSIQKGLPTWRAMR